MITPTPNKQYIELYQQARDIICQHSSDVMNAQRDRAFEDFQRLGSVHI